MEVPEGKYHDLDCYWTWMGDDGIARTKVKPGAEIELKHAKENSLAVNNFDSPASYPIIVDTTNIKSITKEARDHFSMRGRSSKVYAIAIIRNSTIGNMVANFFIGLNKPIVPTKLFSSEEEAVLWCQKITENSHAN